MTTMTLAAQRLISADLLGEHLPKDGGSGPLDTASREFVSGGFSTVGLWDAGPGVDTDTEVDEVFLVLAGSGRVRFEDGSIIELMPGTLVRLVAGDRTHWEITERLRKIYLA